MGFALDDYVDISASFDASRSNAPNQANHQAQYDRCRPQAREITILGWVRRLNPVDLRAMIPLDDTSDQHIR